MHKGVILLVKAENKTEALSLVESFLEPFGDGKEWDWYAIGGRWSNTLAPANKIKEYYEYAEKAISREDGGWISQSEVETKRPLLQAKWKELELLGNCPHSDHYKLPDAGDAYDVTPLVDCIEKVKEWAKDVPAEIEETWRKLIDAKENNKFMVGYFAKRLMNLDYENFCFDSNVYNVTELTAESIPEDITGYFAVMVDLHN